MAIGGDGISRKRPLSQICVGGFLLFGPLRSGVKSLRRIVPLFVRTY
jgi:hypothetical protein